MMNEVKHKLLREDIRIESNYDQTAKFQEKLNLNPNPQYDECCKR